ncbi:MAG: radical SAM family heme chaperone HemW [Gemmatimonadaceae bacterium]
MHAPLSSPPRHVYVHVPFCARRCSYCDFAIAVRSRVPVEDYMRALAAELALRFPASPSGVGAGRGVRAAAIDTLYLGGGTPSLLGGDGVARLLDLLLAHFELQPGAEVTVEANPDDVVVDSVRRWHAAGVNRLSIGAQSFSASALDWMHRTHSSDRIAAAVAAAREGGMANLSLDLIFALPDQIERSWQGDIELALGLEPPHLSLYGLTVEQGTPLARWRERGAAVEAEEDRYASEYLAACALLRDAGYEHYEVSSFARPGARSRHNNSYWSLVPYAGIGPSAHGFDGALRRWNIREYTQWAAALASGSDPLAGSERLTTPEREAEAVYLALRTAEGLSLRPTERERVQPWIAEGWGEIGPDGRLRLTATGWLRLDALAGDLTAFRSR